MTFRFTRKHGIEAAVAVAVLAAGTAMMVPRFLRGQDTVSLLRPAETGLASWESVYGAWEERDSALAPRASAESSTSDWILVHEKRFDGDALRCPVRFGFDVRFGERPKGNRDFWIGFGIGSVRRDVSRDGATRAANIRRFNTAALNVLMLTDDGALQQQLYTDVGLLGETRPARDSADRPLENMEPGQWYRVEWEFTALDWNNGGVEAQGRFWEKDSGHWPSFFSEPEPFTFSSPYTECFNPPCSQLILYVHQSGPMQPVEIANVSVRAHRVHTD